MTTVSGNVETPTANLADPDATEGRSGPRAFVIFTPTENSRLERELTDRGWRVWVAETPANDIVDLLDRVMDFLAEPGSPDRAVLLGCGVVAEAVTEFADRHPERAVAVITVDPPSDPAPQVRLEDLSCPTLMVPTIDPELVFRFLSGLKPQVVQAQQRPAPPPVLTPGAAQRPRCDAAVPGDESGAPDQRPGRGDHLDPDRTSGDNPDPR